MNRCLWLRHQIAAQPNLLPADFGEIVRSAVALALTDSRLLGFLLRHGVDTSLFGQTLYARNRQPLFGFAIFL
jgi:hypothetical protein